MSGGGGGAVLPGRRATMSWWARPFLGQATQARLGLHHLGREETKWETRGERRGEVRRGEERGGNDYGTMATALAMQVTQQH